MDKKNAPSKENAPTAIDKHVPNLTNPQKLTSHSLQPFLTHRFLPPMLAYRSLPPMLPSRHFPSLFTNPLPPPMSAHRPKLRNPFMSRIRSIPSILTNRLSQACQ